MIKESIVCFGIKFDHQSGLKSSRNPKRFAKDMQMKINLLVMSIRLASGNCLRNSSWCPVQLILSLLRLQKTKARFKRRTLHVPNLMQMRENNRFFSFALDSAHVKFDV